MNVYPFIKAEKAEPTGNVALACRLLEVSRAAFYDQLTPSAREVSDGRQPWRRRSRAPSSGLGR